MISKFDQNSPHEKSFNPLILQGAAKGHDFLLSSKALIALL